MIEFRQKDFSKYINEKNVLVLESNYIRVPLEIIKCLEFADIAKDWDFKHWMVGKLANNNFMEARKLDISPQSLLAGCDSYIDNYSNLNSYFGVNSCTSFFSKFKTPEKFKQAVLRKLMTESKQGIEEPKYDKWIKERGLNFVDIYIPLFKFLALCLSGQVDEADYSEFWKMGPKYLTMNIDYSLINKKNSREPYYCNIVARVLYGVGYNDRFKEFFV